MSYNLKKLENGEVEIEVTVSAADLKTESSLAAARLSKDLKIPGFRPGKAPYDIVKKEIGEIKILEEAADKLVADKLNEIIKKENLEIANQPNIQIKKLAPGNDLIFTATMPLFPKVTLPNLANIKISQPEVKVNDNELDKTLNNLRQMRVKEILEKRSAGKDDKVQIDFEVKVDGKIIEGGKAEKYNVIIGENQMIPGFEEQLAGLKENDEKEFTLKLPKNYPLAGNPPKGDKSELSNKVGDFKVKLRGVYKRELPALNDEFAKSCGAKNLDELKEQIKNNLQKQAKLKAKEKQETELIEKVTSAAKFSQIPETLVNAEQQHMLYEFKNQIEQGGGKFDDYLKHIKKNKDEVIASFKDNAEKRVKTGLIFRQIIKENQLKPNQIKVDEEIKKAETMYNPMPKMLEKIKSDTYRNYIESLILNRQVIEWLKNHVA